MPNQTNQRNSQKKIAFAALAVSIVALLIVIIVSVALTYRIDLSITEAESRIASQNARLKFCYNNSIQPCDDTAIVEWNEQNLDDAFRLY